VIKCLEVRIKDPSLLLLIKRFLKAGYIDAGEFVPTKKGTAQGGNLSPMLANIFLHYVLDLWFDKKIRPKVLGACHLVRYADDFLCLVQCLEDARRIERAIRERFVKFNLELHPEKTRIVNFHGDARAKSNRNSHRVQTFDFLGFTHYWGTSRRGRHVLQRKTSKKSFCRACGELSTWLREIRCTARLKDWWPILQAKLRGHYQYYGISGNSRMIGCYDQIARRLVFKWINRRSQKVSFDWPGFNEYLGHYPLPKPRIVHKLYTPSPGS
jgi:hypothetical protein